jgi:ABC-type protease/lipase transport system fused ATPase/permease subunit
MSKKYSEARWSYQNAEDLLETIVKNKENSNLSESEKFIRVEK